MPRPQLAEFMRRMEPGFRRHHPGGARGDALARHGLSLPPGLRLLLPDRLRRARRHRRHRARARKKASRSSSGRATARRRFGTARRAGVEGARRDVMARTQPFPSKSSTTSCTDILNGAGTLYYRLGDGNAELDQTIIRQLVADARDGRARRERAADHHRPRHAHPRDAPGEDATKRSRSCSAPADIAAEAHLRSDERRAPRHEGV